MSDSSVELRAYPGAVDGFLAFRVADSAGHRKPLPGNRVLRRALSLAIDRQAVAQALFGPASRAPSGPMSSLLWIGGAGITVLPYDTAAADRALDAAGWRRSPSTSMRERG